VLQDNLESFLAVAEELQLRGLMGKEESAFEDSQIDDLKIPLPTLDEPACKQEKDISNQQHPPSSTKLSEAKETVRARKEISEGLTEMERQTHLKNGENLEDNLKKADIQVQSVRKRREECAAESSHSSQSLGRIFYSLQLL